MNVLFTCLWTCSSNSQMYVMSREPMVVEKKGVSDVTMSAMLRLSISLALCVTIVAISPYFVASFHV